MKKLWFIMFISIANFIGPVSLANEINNQLKTYQAQGAGEFSASRGEKMWHKNYPDPKKSDKQRNCGVCHTDNLKSKGKHARTGKVIPPLAPSVNSERFSDKKFIEKWFKRNCKWVVGRECTAQEKGDFLVYLRDK